MKQLSLFQGGLVLAGLLLILAGLASRISDFNFLFPLARDISAIFVLANTCLLLALVIEQFGRS